MRDRLIELLSGKSIDTYSDVEYVADHLLANGVIVPHCKVGDNEIIKALECLCDHTLGDCDKCPLYKHIDHDCVPDVIEPALSLINRQQARIDLLEKDNKYLAMKLRQAKVAAIKEFAERLCDGRVSNDPVVIAVKCELKEMVGEDNDQD